MIHTVNLPYVIGIVVGRGHATLRDLQEYYSLEDAYNILETLYVEAYNMSLANEKK